MTITNLGKKIMALLIVLVATVSIVACANSADLAKEQAEENAETVLGKINFGDADRTAITANVTLTTVNKLYPDVKVTWSSDQEDVISTTGVVTRPAYNDERAYVDGSSTVVKVILTATAVASYEADGQILTTDPISRQYTFTVLTLADGTDTGTIAEVKARAWTYIYETSGVSKALVSNSSVTYSVQITGKVTAKLMADGSTKGYMIHDGSEGIYVYDDNTSINVGDVVQVVGDVYSYYGSLQVGSNVTATVISGSEITLPEYRTVTPSEWETESADLDDNTIGYLGGKLLIVEGYLTAQTASAGSDKYCITDASTGEVSWIYYKSYDSSMEETLTANVGKYVKLSGVSYDRDSRLLKNEILWDGGLEEAEAPSVSDDSKVAVILAGITVSSTASEDFELSSEGTWEVVSGTGITIEEGVAKVTVADEEQTVVLKVTVTVGEATDSKEFTVTIPAGKISVITIAEALELCGSTSNVYTTEKYTFGGTIVSIANTTYGNLTIKDSTGEIYLYGLYDSTGARFDAMTTQPVVGDYIIVTTVLGCYSTTKQGKNATMIAQEYGTNYETITVQEANALVPNAGDATTEKIILKGTLTSITNEKYGNAVLKDVFGYTMVVYGLYDVNGNRYDAIEENKPVAGDYVVIEGVMKNYNGTIEIVNAVVKQLNRDVLADDEPVEEKDPLVTDFEVTSYADLAALVPNANDVTTESYYVIGYVQSFTNTTYGNCIIEDEEGNTFTVYGINDFAGRTYANMTTKPAVGDIVVVYGTLKNYSGTVEMVNGILVQLNSDTYSLTVADLLYKLSVPTSVEADFELDESATWTVKEGTAIVIEGSTAKVTQSTEDQTVVLTATMTYNDVTDSKDFTVTVKAALAEGVSTYTYTWSANSGTLEDNVLTIDCGDFTIILSKNTSTSNVVNTYAQIRIYKGAKFEVVAKNGKKIKSIEFADAKKSASEVDLSSNENADNFSYTLESNYLTVTAAEAADSISFVANNAQMQITTLKITYED